VTEISRPHKSVRRTCTCRCVHRWCHARIIGGQSGFWATLLRFQFVFTPTVFANTKALLPSTLRYTVFFFVQQSASC